MSVETLIVLVAAYLALMLFVFGMIAHQLRQLHLTMNSRLDELISTARQLARAEGYQAGQENHLQILREFKDK